MDVRWYINALLVDRSRSDRSKCLSSLWPLITALHVLFAYVNTLTTTTDEHLRTMGMNYKDCLLTFVSLQHPNLTLVNNPPGSEREARHVLDSISTGWPGATMSLPTSQIPSPGAHFISKTTSHVSLVIS